MKIYSFKSQFFYPGLINVYLFVSFISPREPFHIFRIFILNFYLFSNFYHFIDVYPFSTLFEPFLSFFRFYLLYLLQPAAMPKFSNFYPFIDFYPPSTLFKLLLSSLQSTNGPIFFTSCIYSQIYSLSDNLNCFLSGNTLFHHFD